MPPRAIASAPIYRQLALLMEQLGVGGAPQGCSVRCESRHFEHEIDVESGPPAGIFDAIASCGADHIVGEGAQTRGDIWVVANARSVLGEGGRAADGTDIMDRSSSPALGGAGWRR